MREAIVLVLTLFGFAGVVGCSGSGEAVIDGEPSDTGSASTGTTPSDDTSASDDTSSPGDTTSPGDYPEPTYGLSTLTLSHDGVEREYLQYVPESYDASARVPVMMSFHGFGGTANGQLQTADMRDLSESEGFILLYPQGTLLDGDTHWNTYLPGGDNKSDADDFGFISALLDDLSVRYAIDGARVYATGYSNGGDFSYTLACFLSDKVTGIAPVSGLMWIGTQRDCEMTHPTAVLSIHGTADGVRPYSGYQGYMLSIDDSNQYFNNHNNISGPPTVTDFRDGGQSIERYAYEGGDGGVSVVHYKVNGGGHIWFSFNEDGVDVNSLIWDFLSRHDRNGTR